VSRSKTLIDDRWFSNAVTSGKTGDSDNGTNDGDKVVGQTLLVSRRKVKLIQGMEDYERIMLKRLDKSRTL
jgi:hypothetical protein